LSSEGLKKIAANFLLDVDIQYIDVESMILVRGKAKKHDLDCLSTIKNDTSKKVIYLP